MIEATTDQGGNVYERNETNTVRADRGFRERSLYSRSFRVESYARDGANPEPERVFVGIRVAMILEAGDEPGSPLAFLC